MNKPTAEFFALRSALSAFGVCTPIHQKQIMAVFRIGMGFLRGLNIEFGADSGIFAVKDDVIDETA